MTTSKYTVLLICLWLPFLVFSPGCDYRIQTGDSLSFQVNLSPEMAKTVQQEAVECVVYIGDNVYRFPIDHKHEEYGISPGVSGETTVRVEYVDSEGNILCRGEASVDISGSGRTDVIVELTCYSCDTPSIFLDPTSGVRGDQVTVTGRNFGANERIRIDFGSIEGIAKTSTDTQGEFEVTFSIPEDFPVGYREVTVSARGLSSGDIAYAKFELEHSQGIME